MAAAAAAAGDSNDGGGIIRIYIGGLGESVTAADIDKTFGALGRLSGLELVRSKARPAFAFINFQPNNDRALAKLFATYNSCTWKGGRLKVEKAKEHYLHRLKREWAEDAKESHESVEPGTEENLDNNRIKADFLKQENAHIRIYFPKLEKVKSLPLKGTGKHKYSFPRVEVPPLPIHFCDCEEHSKPLDAPMQFQRHLSSREDEAFERERSIMNSVLNRFLQMDDQEEVRIDNLESAEDADSRDPSADDNEMQEAEEAEMSDDDNLVTNIGAGGSDDLFSLMKFEGHATATLVKELPSFDKVQHNKDGQNKTNSLKRQKSERANESGAPLKKQAGKTFSEKLAKDDSGFVIRDGQSEGHMQEGMTLEDTQNVNTPNETNNCIQSTKPHSWLQKSSWKDLVGGSNNSFTISHVLPDIGSIEPKLPDAKDPTTKSTTLEKRKAQSGQDSSSSIQIKKNSSVIGADAERPGKLEEIQKHVQEDELGKTEGKPTPENKRAIPKITISEVCPFMRSADSEKEWAKAKAALSGYIKKKKKDNDGSKSLKGASTNKR